MCPHSFLQCVSSIFRGYRLQVAVIAVHTFEILQRKKKSAGGKNSVFGLCLFCVGVFTLLQLLPAVVLFMFTFYCIYVVMGFCSEDPKSVIEIE